MMTFIWVSIGILLIWDLILFIKEIRSEFEEVDDI